MKPQKYFILTIGCQMNESDAERVSSILEKIGYQKSSEEQADLIIVLACSVRQSAIDRIWGKIKKWNKQKNNKPLITVLSGCVLLKDKIKFRNKFDYILTIDELTNSPQKLSTLLKNKLTSYGLPVTDYFAIHPTHQSKLQAYVPIMTGCGNYCTYCAVPYTRGREKSRPADEIISEIKELIKNGYKEITLLGQNVNSYQSEYEKTNKPFINLLKKIDEISGKFWFFFLTNHPKDMSFDLIDTLPKLKKVGHYIHLPIQSGDDEILKKMNRHYTVSHYLKLIKRIRKVMSDVCISTDIIAGFPGETEKQFNNTVKVMKKVKFDMAYIAQYSPRPGTAADKLKDNVPKSEKKKRKEILTEILKKTALENNQKYIGKEIEILITTPSRGRRAADGQYYIAKTRTFKNVKIHMPMSSATALAVVPNLVGQFTKVKITKVGPWGLEGYLI